MFVRKPKSPNLPFTDRKEEELTPASGREAPAHLSEFAYDPVLRKSANSENSDSPLFPENSSNFHRVFISKGGESIEWSADNKEKITKKFPLLIEAIEMSGGLGQYNFLQSFMDGDIQEVLSSLQTYSDRMGGINDSRIFEGETNGHDLYLVYSDTSVAVTMPNANIYNKSGKGGKPGNTYSFNRAAWVEEKQKQFAGLLGTQVTPWAQMAFPGKEVDTEFTIDQPFLDQQIGLMANTFRNGAEPGKYITDSVNVTPSNERQRAYSFALLPEKIFERGTDYRAYGGSGLEATEADRVYNIMLNLQHEIGAHVQNRHLPGNPGGEHEFNDQILQNFDWTYKTTAERMPTGETLDDGGWEVKEMDPEKNMRMRYDNLDHKPEIELIEAVNQLKKLNEAKK